MKSEAEISWSEREKKQHYTKPEIEKVGKKKKNHMRNFEKDEEKNMKTKNQYWKYGDKGKKKTRHLKRFKKKETRHLKRFERRETSHLKRWEKERRRAIWRDRRKNWTIKTKKKNMNHNIFQISKSKTKQVTKTPTILTALNEWKNNIYGK